MSFLTNPNDYRMLLNQSYVGFETITLGKKYSIEENDVAVSFLQISNKYFLFKVFTY